MGADEHERAKGFFNNTSFAIGSQIRHQTGDWPMVWIKDSETAGRQLNTKTKTARWIQAHPTEDLPPSKPDPWDEDEAETEATSADAVADALDQGSARAPDAPMPSMAVDGPIRFFYFWTKKTKGTRWAAMDADEQEAAEEFFNDPSLVIGSKRRHHSSGLPSWVVAWPSPSPSRASRPALGRRGPGRGPGS